MKKNASDRNFDPVGFWEGGYDLGMTQQETVAGKALWFVESHLADDLTLATVAEASGVGKHHATRAFGVATGMPLMRYVRGRRLSAAAHRLAGGARDILEVAVESGYASHEAFTRAFREEFGMTPETVRERGSVAGLAMTEAVGLEEAEWDEAGAMRVAEGEGKWIVGTGACDSAGIPGLWERFGPYIGQIAGQVGSVAYGVCHSDGYLAGVEVREGVRVAEGWTRVRLAEARYAVFAHPGHISTIRRTWFTIWNRWLGEQGFSPTGEPEFERYGEEFDARTGVGGLTIWVPVGPK